MELLDGTPREMVLVRSPFCGFGFTLRHFIVYPPEPTDESSAIEGALFNHRQEPLDTIFVKYVRPGSPAYLAGLTTGDRIVQVNESNVSAHTYQDIVTEIQRTPDELHLVIVAGQHDILQQVFGSTAHSPHSNLDLRPSSPSRVSVDSFGFPDSLGSQRESLISSHSLEDTEMPSLPARRLGKNPFSRHTKPTKESRKCPSPMIIDRKQAVYNKPKAAEPVRPARHRITEPIKVKSEIKEIEQKRLERDANGRLYEVQNNFHREKDILEKFYPTIKQEPKDYSRNSWTLSPTPNKTQEAIDKIRKTVEKKGEFLYGSKNFSFPPRGALVYRQYQVCPQKIIPRPIWPPLNEFEEENFEESEKPYNLIQDKEKLSPGIYEQIKKVENTVPKPYTSEDPYYKSSKPFVSKLSKIQENVSSLSESLSRRVSESLIRNVSSPTPTFTQSEARFGSETSLSSTSTTRSTPFRPIPWVANERVKPLQIVSVRAKKFESSMNSSNQSMQSDDSSPSINYNDLSASLRASAEKMKNKQSGSPSVTRSFSDGDFAQNIVNAYKDPLLDSSQVCVGNRSNPVGGPKIHCEPPENYKISEKKKGAVSSFHKSSGYIEEHKEYERSVPSALDPSTLPITSKLPPAKLSTIRPKGIIEHERIARRISYLKATSSDKVICSDSESDDDKSIEPIVEPVKKEVPKDLNIEPPKPLLKSSIILHGHLNVKLARYLGKRAGDRSWKSVYAVIRGKTLIFYKDKQIALQTPLSHDDHIGLKGCCVEVASDYGKKKNVLRLVTPVGSQFLLQAESEAAMTAWLSSVSSSTGQTSKEPKTPLPSPVVEKLPELPSPAQEHDNESLNKSFRKVTSPKRGKDSPSQYSSMKARKSTDGDMSVKGNTWKRIGRHLKKMHGTAAPALPHGASIGVCLEDCPPSQENEMVPFLVAVCVGVVESKGMGVQGIYRIPGNKAAVNYLTEMVNQGPEFIDLFDSRWSDMNVISSLIKQFFQKLPEPLISSDLYCSFIEASKIEDSHQRLVELKSLVQELPDHHYETLRFIISHFGRIAENSEHNKMDIKNLAIVFGPTLIRTAEDNVAKMVTDMSHQCRILESFIVHRDWFFHDAEFDSSLLGPEVNAQTDAEKQEMQNVSQSLLNNISKLNGSNYKETKKIVSSLISAANRIHKNRNKKTETEHSEERPELPDPLPMNERRISNISVASLPPQPIEKSDSNLSSIHKNLTKEPSYLGDELAIRSYSGLSARTQERIKQFERETRAMMLQRDILSRQESQKLETNRKKVEDQLKKAKRDLETEDIYDKMAKNPSEIVPRIGDYLAKSASSDSRETVSFPLTSTGNFSLTSESSLLTEPSNEPLTDALTSLHNNQEDSYCIPDITYSDAPIEGSDLLRDITETFEEKMRNLQDPQFLQSDIDTIRSDYDSLNHNDIINCDHIDEKSSIHGMGLYRDPSLHRKRTLSRDLYDSLQQSPEKEIDRLRPHNSEPTRKAGDKKNKDTKRSKTQEIYYNVDENVNPKKMDDKNAPKKKKKKIKRRHTVGGTDLAHVVLLRALEARQVPVKLFVEQFNKMNELIASREKLEPRGIPNASLHPILESNV